MHLLKIIVAISKKIKKFNLKNKNYKKNLLTKFFLWSKIIDLFDRRLFLMYNELILKALEGMGT